MTTESKGLAGETILQVYAESYCFNFTIDGLDGKAWFDEELAARCINFSDESEEFLSEFLDDVDEVINNAHTVLTKLLAKVDGLINKDELEFNPLDLYKFVSKHLRAEVKVMEALEKRRAVEKAVKMNNVVHLRTRNIDETD
jgi:hypothetical protein